MSSDNNKEALNKLYLSVEIVLQENVLLPIDQLVAHSQLQLELLNLQVLALQNALVHDAVLLELHVLQLQTAHLVLQLHQLAAVLSSDLVAQLVAEVLGLLLVVSQTLGDVLLHAVVLHDGLAQLLALLPRLHDLPRAVRDDVRGEVGLGESLGVVAFALLVDTAVRLRPLDDDQLPLADFDAVLHVLVFQLDQRPSQLHALLEVLHNALTHIIHELSALTTCTRAHALAKCLEWSGGLAASWQVVCGRPRASLRRVCLSHQSNIL